MSLTLFFEHLDLQVFIFGVFNCVVVRTVIILITKGARVKNLVRWNQIHQNGSDVFSNYFLVIYWKWLGLSSVLTFFNFINHGNCEGTRVTIFLVFLLSSFPRLALDTTSCSLTCAQLSLESDKYACSQDGLRLLHINIPRHAHTHTHTWKFGSQVEVISIPEFGHAQRPHTQSPRPLQTPCADKESTTTDV